MNSKFGFNIYLDSQIHFTSHCPNRESILKNLRIPNPSYQNAVRLNEWYKLEGMKKEFTFYREDPHRAFISAPIGVKEYLFPFCTTCKFQCPIYDCRTKGQKPKELPEYVTELIPRPSQLNGLMAMRSFIASGGNGLVQMPTGCGKTVFSFLLAREAKANCLFVTQTKDLAYQTYNKFTELFGREPGLIGDGVYKIDEHFTIAIINSLYRKLDFDDWNDKFSMLIYDECHRSPTMMAYEVLSNLTMKHKIGLSATMNVNSDLRKLLYGLFGRVVYQIDIPQAQKEGSLVPLIPEYVYSDFFTEVQTSKFNKRATVLKLVREASRNLKRNTLIVNTVVDKLIQGHRSILVLNSIEQCEILKKLFDETEFKVEIYTGEQKPKERKTLIDKMRSGEVKALLTVQLAGMGLDIPEASHLLFDKKISDALSVEQIAGRVVRYCPGKTHAVITDIVDKDIPHFLRQSQDRFKIYKKFGATI